MSNVIPIRQAPPRCERCKADAEGDLNIAGEYPVRLCRACRRSLIVAMQGWEEQANYMTAANLMQVLVTHIDPTRETAEFHVGVAVAAACRTRAALYGRVEQWLKDGR